MPRSVGKFPDPTPSRYESVQKINILPLHLRGALGAAAAAGVFPASMALKMRDTACPQFRSATRGFKREKQKAY